MPRRTPEEIEQLIYRHSDMVYRILRVRFPHRPEDVNDLYQEVFLKLVENSDKLQTDSHVKHWLIRVTINAGKSLISSWYHRKTVSIDDDANDDFAPMDIGDTGPTDMSATEKEVLGRENAQTIYAAVCGLPEPYRVVIHLAYYESLSMREIANSLSTTEGAVKTRLSRARYALKDELTKRGYHADALL